MPHELPNAFEPGRDWNALDRLLDQRKTLVRPHTSRRLPSLLDCQQ
jgi:hypothetical protein